MIFTLNCVYGFILRGFPDNRGKPEVKMLICRQYVDLTIPLNPMHNFEQIMDSEELVKRIANSHFFIGFQCCPDPNYEKQKSRFIWEQVRGKNRYM